jgi:hypothetical protein
MQDVKLDRNTCWTDEANIKMNLGGRATISIENENQSQSIDYPVRMNTNIILKSLN